MRGWEKRPARQRRASEDAAARRDAEKRESKGKRRQAKGPDPKATDRPVRQSVQPDAAGPVEPSQPEEKAAGKRPTDPGIWAGRALQARDREAAERDRFTYRRPPGAGSSAGLADEPAPRGTHHDRSLKDSAQRRHDDIASARYQQGLTDRDVAAKRKAEWDAQEPRHTPAGKSRRADLNDSQWDINEAQVPATGRHAPKGNDVTKFDGVKRAGAEAYRQRWGNDAPVFGEADANSRGVGGEWRARNAGQGGKGMSSGGDIQSMRDDFPRVIAAGQQVIEDAVTSMRQQVSSAVAESPSNQTVKDAADQWAAELAALTARGDEIIALSRQADQVGYDAADQYGTDPNRHAWMD